MKKDNSLMVCILRSVVLIAFLTGFLQGCTLFGNSINNAIELRSEKQYDKAVQLLDNIIDSDASDITKAQAFMLRGKSYTSLHEYKHAYRDLQVAWKISCEIYQNYPEHKLLPKTTNSNSTKTEPSQSLFQPAYACVETIPILLDNLKPFTSEFAAIMATQEASKIIKKMFPLLSE
ncbi:hypothetical protein [Desulfovibrio sp. UCD-KL4C]|uniref:tetratricopeptide repeat protein n=1 Tax=Desulfovibrio sp. UCD-KL4C TaxID=2578120 RepID=UPI0025BD1D70|nr:hypothetical protein [Desulfovibrio sp. UCD-KL4C]